MARPCVGWRSAKALGLLLPGPSEATARWASPAERSDGPLHPLWLRRGAQRFADKGSQLSERNAVERVLRDPAKREHRRLPRSAAEGSQIVGRLFFGYFLLAKQKKVTRPPGRVPAYSLSKRKPHPSC